MQTLVDILNRKATVYNPAKHVDEVFGSCVWSYCSNPWEFPQMIQAVCTHKIVYAMHSTVHTIYPALTSVFAVGTGPDNVRAAAAVNPNSRSSGDRISQASTEKINVAFPELLCLFVWHCVCVWHQIKPQKRRLWRAHKNPSPSISGRNDKFQHDDDDSAALWVYPIEHASMTCYSILATRNTHTHTCASNTTRCTALCLLVACLSHEHTHFMHGLWTGYLCSPQ